MSIRLLVGLGNPGPDYQSHRHNVGYWLLDALCQDHAARLGVESKLHGETGRLQLAGQDIRLLKPTTFMNRSGLSVQAALRYWKIDPEEMLVVHDDLDLPAGVARLKFDGGHGGQNGLRDIIAQLGGGRFQRLRLGIGHPGHRDKVTGWVLGRPGRDDELLIRRAIDSALEVLPWVAQGRLNDAMQKLHTPAALARVT